jgi:hypothetical protein
MHGPLGKDFLWTFIKAKVSDRWPLQETRGNRVACKEVVKHLQRQPVSALGE